MKIGILSDSHGKSKRLARGIDLLLDASAEAIVHCGDIENVEGIQLLGDSHLPSYLAAGNMDVSRFGRLQAAADSCGVIFAADFVTVPLNDGDGDGDKKYLAATHGKDELLLDELIRDEQYPYVCHGHTHRTSDQRINSTRVLNPGALYHPRGDTGRTVMLLDTDTDTVKIISVE